MIKNEAQLTTAIKALHKYESAIENFDLLKEIESGVSPIIAKAQLESYKSQASTLHEQIADFKNQKADDKNSIEINGVTAIGPALVRSRISRGWTQKFLADQLNLKEQQIQRYEKESYRAASLVRLAEVANALNVDLHGALEIGASKGNYADFGLDLDDFPISEMNKLGWFEPKLNLRKCKPDDRVAALSRFLSNAQLDTSASVLHKRTIGPERGTSKGAFLVWRAEAIKQASRLSQKLPQYSELNAKDFKQLTKLSIYEDGPKRAVQQLRDHGIAVVFVERLPKTCLDGGAFLLGDGRPAIAMTLRHDRLDNFWFVLLHELGHIKLHWKYLKDGNFVEENVGESDSETEREADSFAANAIVSDEHWENSFVRFTSDAEAVIRFAHKHSVHPALIAGKIRKENGYHLLSKLIGQGEVKKSLKNYLQSG
ncbi:XRE family transcriptional regulator [uncultured Parasphingorhabdus sp.]|uniref:helix-turn-helix domain-containing protein n=1 Tax=uncultured Parasphingorhabdus sp. TaxID=2709694 RepID=UPI002AA626F9|nr:XRE family transcriptional regulator [uncultured Parasphingorhabdus sp.]